MEIDGAEKNELSPDQRQEAVDLVKEFLKSLRMEHEPDTSEKIIKSLEESYHLEPRKNRKPKCDRS